MNSFFEWLRHDAIGVAGGFYEVKFDGYRCLAANRFDGVVLWSRRGNRFNTDFPEIARACGKLPAG